ncbi:hypothetical protein [Micromonospora lutea]|uniref:hypothetical protein n=1 Tax=Micromonospora lutea TaxID=419825 RepID=UPI00194E465D|nr:hypothetical protein [Micromonospora lutea]
MPPSAGSQVSRVPAQRTPPEELAPPAVTPAPRRPRRRLRTVLTVIAGVVAALCLAGGVVGYLVYDRAVTPDRSAPDVVVDNYLRAFLVDRNDVRASLFTCEGSSDLAEVRDLRSEIQQRELDYDVVVRVSWGALHLSGTGGDPAISTTLTISSSSDGEPRSSRREAWVFGVSEHADEWRVCSGRQVPN